MKPIVNTTEIISHIQIEADRTAYEYLKIKAEIEEMKKLIKVDSFLNFNLIYWWSFIFPIIVDFEILDFLIKNCDDLKRKLNFQEFIDFSDKFRLLKSYDEYPRNFEDFKKMYAKIKLIERNEN